MAKKKAISVKSVLADFRALDMNEQQAFFRGLDMNERKEFADSLTMGELIKIPLYKVLDNGSDMELEIERGKRPKNPGKPARNAEILRLHQSGKKPIAIGRTESVKALNNGKAMQRQAVENIIKAYSK